MCKDRFGSHCVSKEQDQAKHCLHIVDMHDDSPMTRRVRNSVSRRAENDISSGARRLESQR